MNNMTRDKMIETRIDDDVKTIEWAPEFLDSILMNGFKGYDYYTDEELEEDYNLRFFESTDTLMAKLENE